MRRLRHPNIIRLVEALDTPEQVREMASRCGHVKRTLDGKYVCCFLVGRCCCYLYVDTVKRSELRVVTF